MVLRETRLERLVAEGRATCRAALRELLDAELAPLGLRIAEQIWARLRPTLLAARHPAG